MSSLTAGVSGGMVVGLLLASGFGRRFDAGGRRNKLLARLPDGRTVVSASARALCEALDHVAIVIPARGVLLEAALSDLPVRLVRNSRAKEGIGASIAVGVATLKADYPQAAGWLIALGDMPFILPRTIRAIAETLPAVNGSKGRVAVAASYQGRRGHPVVFSRAFDDALLRLDGDAGASSVLATADVRAVECEDPGILRDIDTREDLELVMQTASR